MKEIEWKNCVPSIIMLKNSPRDKSIVLSQLI